ncbi:NAD-dependent epimerase/dehydratase family protein [Nisaea acidiphila]|uniref:NAD-dependent epimerase/dehydratase family protein n=1 Tax=Nisaea acidiphila TaxID=1862145 RepID=A0A9J7API1_9PROT|nr:NAD-dependent epimerase/dehydratase family protein [Nisaea acidiphila]UUX48505.1 NAD-dependent epimerase/dehydratase family protein [Nisaea acidiphila]
MTVLLTGAAGFIGMHVAEILLARGERVVGIDNLNSYYDPALKHARLKTLEGRNGFTFEELEIADDAAVTGLTERYPDIDRVVHLAAQAGVRYSIDHPGDYVRSNLVGHANMLEFVRGLMDRPAGCRSFVYASSSSVYGANREMPFSTGQKTDSPVSFYGATKKANELLSYSYAHLYRVPSTGLRFFTVYGPWGRPDMSPWLFTSAILEGRPIRVFNNGDMMRDFTYIDDIAKGVVAAMDHPPSGEDGACPHMVYNLGNNTPVKLLDYIRVIEEACGVPAIMDMQPMQPGDVYATYADIDPAAQDLGYAPSTPIGVGIPKFVEWYKRYHGV